jgi:hypothetical protein
VRIVQLLVVFATTLWSVPVFAQPLTAVQFRDLFAERVEIITNQPTTAIDEETFKTSSAVGEELTINTENAYSLYLQDTSKIEAVLEKFAVSVVASQQSGVEGVEQLVVILRPSNYIKRSIAADASLENFIAPRPVAGDVSFFLAVDSPINLRSVSPADLKRWKINEVTAWEIAIKNLKVRVGPVNFIRLGTESGAQGIGAESGLAPSILAQAELCGVNKPTGISNQIVLLYSKDMFLFTLPSDSEMTSTFWSVVKSEIAAGNSLSTTPLTCKEGRWVVAAVPM